MGLTLAYTSASELHYNMTFPINLHQKNPFFAWFPLLNITCDPLKLHVTEAKHQMSYVILFEENLSSAM